MPSPQPKNRSQLSVVNDIVSAAIARPDSPAVCAAPTTWTYRRLLKAAEQVRDRLERSKATSEPVVFVATRTCGSLAMMLGCLLAGRPFAPIDPADPQPEARAQRFGAGRLVLDPDRFSAGSDSLQWNPAAAVARRAGGERPAAYHLLTSGTTAYSKVVEVSQANLSAYVTSLRERLRLDRPMHWAAVSSLATDLSYTAIFPALATGGCVHIVGDGVRRDGRAFQRYVQRHGVEAIKMTPSHCRALLASARERFDDPLRLLILGGELLSPALAATILEYGRAERVVNHYGPTEATVGVACHVVELSSSLDHDAPSVPIGTPLGEAELVVVRDDERPAEAGDIGRLLIGGPTVANGYRGDLALTNKHFVLADPDGGGRRRFFVTDDWCRVLDDGALEFLCRNGTEVKVRGWRVEPSAVEQAICGLPSVRDARIVVQNEGEQTFLDAIVASDNGIPADLRDALARRLPALMVPRRLAVVKSLPLLNSGKFDTQAGIRLLRGIHSEDRESPQMDPLVSEIAEVMAPYLGGHRPGPRDDFSFLGGDSLAAIHVLSRLQDRGHDLDAETFLRDMTPSGIAASIRSVRRKGLGGAELRMTRAQDVLSPAQRWFFAQDFAESDRWCQGILLDAPAPIESDALEAAGRNLLQRHPLLRTRFERDAAVADGWRVRAAEEVLSVHTAESDGLEAETERMLRWMDIGEGRLFAMTLLGAPQARDRLLLLAHHLVVDGVAWRILLDDLATAYCAALHEPSTEAVAGSAPLRQEDPAVEAVRRPLACPATPGGNAAVATAVVTFDEASTAALERSALAAGHGLHEVLLAAFALELAPRTGEETVDIDVEHHGRTGQSGDLGRAIGWFTTTVRAAIPIERDRDFRVVLAAVGQASGGGGSENPIYAEVAPACFNYLGRFVAPGGGNAGWSFSSRILGPLRGQSLPGHEFTLTGRVVNGRLTLDLVFRCRGEPAERGIALARRIARCLVAFATGLESPRDERFEVQLVPWSCLGQLALAPLPAPSPERIRRVDSAASVTSVLLTGATGFLGIYLLRELLGETVQLVVCLVRPNAGESGRERLARHFKWYFGADIDAFGDRLQVIEGDVTRRDLGLPQQRWAKLAAQLDTVVHCAADVRLFTDYRTAEIVNVGGTRQVIEFAEAGRPKAVHLMSTMSVAGQWPGPEDRPFTEFDREYGQAFRSPYEESKLQAEVLISRFVARGGVGWSHRLGSIVRPVGPGRSQIDLANNRIAQTLRLYAHSGAAPELPDEQLLLTPVDWTAHAVVQIASAATLEGGTTHLVNDSVESHTEIVATLRRLGHGVSLVAVEEFRRRTRRLQDSALVRWWLARGPRRVSFRSRWTLDLLAQLGVPIEVEDRARWLELVAEDALGMRRGDLIGDDRG